MSDVEITVPGVWPERDAGRFASFIGAASEVPAGAADERFTVALLGLPDDTGVRLNNGRPGAAEGPLAFRAALASYGARDAAGICADGRAWPPVVDAGDVVPSSESDPARALRDTHERVFAAACRLQMSGFFVVGIGGGHDLTYPLARAAATRYGPLEMVYLDAHLDVREEPGSGMPFRRLFEGGWIDGARVVGIDRRVNTAEHSDYFRSCGGREILSVEGIAEGGSAGAAYASIDLDAVDASAAPGVSALNPCGLSPREADRFAETVGWWPELRGFDIMELSPPHDEQGRTARLAARLFLTLLMSLRRSRAAAEADDGDDDEFDEDGGDGS